jgi:hypothetical protein
MGELTYAREKVVIRRLQVRGWLLSETIVIAGR